MRRLCQGHDGLADGEPNLSALTYERDTKHWTKLKYGATAMAFCPILDKKVENFDKDDLPQVMKFFTQYCKTKGKTC